MTDMWQSCLSNSNGWRVVQAAASLVTTAFPLRLLLLLLKVQTPLLFSALLLVGDVFPCSGFALLGKGYLRLGGRTTPLQLLRDLALSAFWVARHPLYLADNGWIEGGASSTL